MELITDCHLCHKERHRYINLEKGVWFCQRCREGGRIEGLPDREFFYDVKPKERKEEPIPDVLPLSEFSRDFLQKEKGISPTVVASLEKNNLLHETEKGIIFSVIDYPAFMERRWKPHTPRWKRYTYQEVPPGMMYILRPVASKRIVIVEGILDALTIAPLGCVAAVLTNRMTPEQAEHLANYFEEVVLLFDGDEAGVEGTLESQAICQEYFPIVRECYLWEKDPNDLGTERIQEILNGL